jgi:hypothetical protein
LRAPEYGYVDTQIHHICTDRCPARRLPPAHGDTTLIITIRRENTALADAPVSVRGDMNHADADGVARIPFMWTMEMRGTLQFG